MFVKHHRPARGTYTRPLALEQLEDRLVLAGGLVNNLVVFGDSLSDGGNVAILAANSLPFSVPIHSELYFEGRFSNGPVWVDYLADYLGEDPLQPSLAGGLNYAYGAAALRDIDLPFPYSAVPSIGDQIASYLDAGHQPQADDLFAILGAPNDFFFSNPLPGPDQVAAAMGDHIETLLAAGARRFVVANIPPLGQTPAFLDLVKIDPAHQAVVDGANAWSLGYNFFLHAELTALQSAHPDALILEVDMASLFVQAAQPGNPYGFVNWTEGVGPYDALGHVTAITAPDAENHIFFDSVHPTTKGHQVLGTQAAAQVYAALGVHRLHVTTSADGSHALDGERSLREMIQLANVMPGEQTIAFQLAPGQREIVLIAGELLLTDDLRIEGGVHSPIQLNGNQMSRIFHIAPQADVALEHLILSNGIAEQGGAILNAGALTLRHVLVTGNQASNPLGAAEGGGIYNSGSGSLKVAYTTFLDNRTSGRVAKGGAIANAGAAEIRSSLFLGNQAIADDLALGGALANLDGAVTDVLFSLFAANRAVGRDASGSANAGDALGGAIFNDTGSTLSLRSTSLVGNSARGGKASGGAKGDGLGGGIYLAAGSSLTRKNSLIAGNFASTGGNNLFSEL